MAWTYDTGLAEDKDTIRLYIGDTIESIPLLSDEEIEATLALESDNLLSTAERLCRSLSARFGREAELYTDNVRDLKTKQAEHFLKLAERYAQGAAVNTSFVFTGGIDSTGASREPFFTREMHLDETVVSRELNSESS